MTQTRRKVGLREGREILDRRAAQILGLLRAEGWGQREIDVILLGAAALALRPEPAAAESEEAER